MLKPLIHSVESQAPWPIQAARESTKAKPGPAACTRWRMTSLSRSAVAFALLTSAALKTRLQLEFALKMRG